MTAAYSFKYSGFNPTLLAVMSKGCVRIGYKSKEPLEDSMVK